MVWFAVQLIVGNTPQSFWGLKFAVCGYCLPGGDNGFMAEFSHFTSAENNPKLSSQGCTYVSCWWWWGGGGLENYAVGSCTESVHFSFLSHNIRTQDLAMQLINRGTTAVRVEFTGASNQLRWNQRLTIDEARSITTNWQEWKLILNDTQTPAASTAAFWSRGQPAL